MKNKMTLKVIVWILVAVVLVATIAFFIQQKLEANQDKGKCTTQKGSGINEGPTNNYGRDLLTCP